MIHRLNYLMPLNVAPSKMNTDNLFLNQVKHLLKGEVNSKCELCRIKKVIENLH